MKFFAILALLLTVNVFAQDSRWIDLEWEPVAEAREYEIELFQEEEGKPLPRGKYKTDSPQWSHAVPPGKYFIRLRSMDKRGVPGEWSPNIPLKVRMQNPLLLRPVAGDKVSDEMIKFEWAPVPGAANYQIVVRSKDKKILHNAVTPELSSGVYIDYLGGIQWTVLALEIDEEPRSPEEIQDVAFKEFERVGRLLDAPTVAVSMNDKVIFNWTKVRSAEIYEVDYYPVPDSGEKNRRFRLKHGPLTFPTARLKNGISTITVKAIAPGHQDSHKSIVKISRHGEKFEIEDIIQGKEIEEIRSSPTTNFFRNELFFGVSIAQFSYESENYETDTRLNQNSLTGLGFVAEWNRRPTFNSLNRKLELSFQHLSSGVASGFIATRGAYSYHKEKKWGSRTISYGGGLSYLSLPAFMGNRFDNNKIKVEPSSSVGPEFQLGLNQPFGPLWELQTSLIFAYHPFFISSRASGESALPFIKGFARVHRFYTEKQAFYGQVDYQTWSQEWKEDKSELSGITMSFGIMTAY